MDGVAAEPVVVVPLHITAPEVPSALNVGVLDEEEIESLDKLLDSIHGDSSSVKADAPSVAADVPTIAKDLSVV